MATAEQDARRNGALVGAGVNAIGGAALGALISGPAAPVGAVIGAVIGGIFGAVAGAGVGGAVYNRAEETRELEITTTKIEQDENTERIAVVAPYVGVSLIVVVLGCVVWLIRRAS